MIYKSKFKNFLTLILRILPFVCIAGGVLWFLRDGRNLTIDDILNYSPASPAAALIFLLSAYALKSLSMMFPVMVLFAVGGSIFPLPLALPANLAGLFICLNIPYWIGRGSGRDLTERLLKKHPKLLEFREERDNNSFFYSFIFRVLGILPCDIVSLYCGNTRVPYKNYITGAMLGFMPDLLCATVAGCNISDPSSPWFWGAVVINVFVCVVAMIFFAVYQKKKSRLSGGVKNG